MKQAFLFILLVSVPLLAKHFFLLEGAAPFNPSDLPGLVVWFDANRITGVSGGSPLATWTNTAGGTNATASGTAQPTYVTNSLNGLAGVSFNGSTNYMTFNGTNYVTAGTAATIAFVAILSPPSGTWYLSLFGLSTPTTNQNFFLFFSNDSGFSDFTFGSAASPGVAGIKGAGNYTSAAASGIIQYNGGTVTSTGSWTYTIDSSSVSLSTTAANGSTGNNNFLGSYPDTGGTLFFQGVLYEFIVCSSINGTQLSNLETYFANKWGI